MSISERRNDSRRASWRTRFARAVNGSVAGRRRGLPTSDDPLDLDAYLAEPDVQVGEHASCRAMLVAHQGEQQVLGADVRVVEDSRLLGRALDRVAGRLREAMQTALRLVVLGDPPRADSGLHRREIDRRAGDHVGRDLEHAEQQVLGRDDVLALALDVLQGRLENRDVLPDGHERSLGALDQAGQALLHDPAIDDTERARHEIREPRARAR